MDCLCGIGSTSPLPFARAARRAIAMTAASRPLEPPLHAPVDVLPGDVARLLLALVVLDGVCHPSLLRKTQLTCHASRNRGRRRRARSGGEGRGRRRRLNKRRQPRAAHLVQILGCHERSIHPTLQVVAGEVSTPVVFVLGALEAGEILLSWRGTRAVESKVTSARASSEGAGH